VTLKLFVPDRLSVEEALAQLKDFTLMTAANLAYRHAETHKNCEECGNMIGDSIRAMMRPQQ
jgi:hypothetical protein